MTGWNLPPGVSSDDIERNAVDMTDADAIRELLMEMGMGQRQAAREIEIGERDMRAYCAGADVPRYVLLALARLADIKSALHREPDIHSESDT